MWEAVRSASAASLWVGQTQRTSARRILAAPRLAQAQRALSRSPSIPRSQEPEAPSYRSLITAVEARRRSAYLERVSKAGMVVQAFTRGADDYSERCILSVM